MRRRERGSCSIAGHRRGSGGRAPVPSPCVTVWLALLGAAVVSGCASNPSSGWSFGTSFDTSIRTVAIPLFDNRTYEPGLELELGEAMVQAVQSKTPYRLASQERADTVLTGTIRSVNLGSFSSRAGTGFVQEQTIEVVVDFEWRNTLTGEVLVSERRFMVSSLFIPSAPSSERIDRGRREAVEELAGAIVGRMRGRW